MTQNPDSNASLDAAVRHVNAAFANLTLAMEKIDEAKNEDEHSQTTRVFTVRQNAIRAISNPHRLQIPSPSLTVDFYNALRAKLDISDELQQNQFQGNHEFKSPLDFVNILVSNHDATHAAVKKLFEKQYEIKWHTETGDPDQFSFYKFCKSVGEDVMTYETRRAHVISRLYQTQEKLRKIGRLTHRQLCPPIYVRCGRSRWKKFTYGPSNELRETRLSNGTSWISNVALKRYIYRNSKEYESASINNKEFLGGRCLPTQLYWAVFEEDDYDQYRRRDEPLPLETQVYVGKAANGINERWLGTGTAHCKRMEIARDVMFNMLSYDPTALLQEQLVDLRFLLHKACNLDGSNSGLFIMKDGENEEAEKRNINGYITTATQPLDTTPIFTNYPDWRPKDMNYGLNKR